MSALTSVRLMILWLDGGVGGGGGNTTLQTPPVPSSAERSELPVCQPLRLLRPPGAALRQRCYLALWHTLCLGKEAIKTSSTEN